MKKLFLLSFPLFFGSCAHSQLPDHLYIPDLVNRVCVEYKIIDKVNFKMQYVREFALIEKGHCDRMVGFTRVDFKQAQNAYRDAVKECQK